MFTRSCWPYLDIINLTGPHFWFSPKGLAYDFGSKFPISPKFVYSQIRPGNDVCWIFRVKSKWFWLYMSMSNLSSRHIGFLPNGLAYDFGSKNFKFLQSLYMVKLDLKMMFGDDLKWNQRDSNHIWGCQIWAAEILDFFQRGWPMIFCQNFKFPVSSCMVKLKGYNWVISRFILTFSFYT